MPRSMRLLPGDEMLLGACQLIRAELDIATVDTRQGRPYDRRRCQRHSADSESDNPTSGSLNCHWHRFRRLTGGGSAASPVREARGESAAPAG